MTTIVRIQRRGGKVVSDCDLYIGRQVTRGGWDLPASKWANPYTIAACGSAERAVALYEAYLLQTPALMASLGELRDKVLGCFCKPAPCHGDVLVRLADAPQGE